MNFQFSTRFARVARQVFNFQFIKNIKPNRGQVVLILVLITVVGLTIGLSLISRTVTDVRISSQLEQSSRAFSAAEAGVETALKSAENNAGSVKLGDASADFQIQEIGNSQSTISYALTQENESRTVWLNNHDADGNLLTSDIIYPYDQNLAICWGTGDEQPAMLVSIFYIESGVYKVAKGAYDHPSITRTTPSHFDDAIDADQTICKGFKYEKIIKASDLGVPNTVLLAMTLRPVFSSSPIAVTPTGNTNLPLQGKLITSVGQSSTGIVRKIRVTQGYQEMPSIFDFGLFIAQ